MSRRKTASSSPLRTFVLRARAQGGGTNPSWTSYEKLREVIERAKGASLSIGHGGNGTAMHLTAELLNAAAGIQIARVPYRGTAPVNWCPGLGTVLANEEVTSEGRSERGNMPVFWCSTTAERKGRCLAVPSWMFDRAACLTLPRRHRSIWPHWII